MNPIRIVLAEEQVLVRGAIAFFLRSIPDMRVLGEAGDGLEALSLIRKSKPDVVLMAVVLPGMNGLEVLTHVMADLPRTRVILFSRYTDENYVRRAFQAGAVGFLAKQSPLAQLEVAIRTVVAGQSYLSPAQAKYVLDAYVRDAVDPKGSLESLSHRQREILQLIAEGYTTKVLAKKLGISVSTAVNHRSNLMHRLGMHDVVSLVRYAIEEGLVETSH